MDSNWDLKEAVLIQVIYNQHTQSFRATRASELRTQMYENTEHCESQLKAVFDTFWFLVMGKDKTWYENATAKNRDQESRDATLARIIAEAVAQQTKSIVEAVSKQKAEETQSLTDVFQRQMEETRAQYEEL